MFKVYRRGVVEIGLLTILLSAGAFLCNGLYSMFNNKLQVNELRQLQQNVIELQNKYCEIDNPSPDQQKICIQLLKLNKVNKK